MEIKVLCLDDEASIRLSLERSLRRFCIVKTVSSHEEALAALRDFEPDILLCDQFVGKGDLLSFIKKVEEAKPKLSFFIITGDIDSGQLEDVKKKCSFEGVLQKPINISNLKEVILSTADKIADWRIA